MRCVLGSTRAIADLGDDERAFEERVSLWLATDFDDAIAQAEAEAAGYDKDIGSEYLGLAQPYELFDKTGHGAEVFSLIRTSSLPTSEYLNRFFDSGSERQRAT